MAFASSGNRDLFLEEPEKHLPRYGGYCACGVAEGGLFDIAPDAWTIHEGRLYLNQSRRVRKSGLKTSQITYEKPTGSVRRYKKCADQASRDNDILSEVS